MDRIVRTLFILIFSVIVVGPGCAPRPAPLIPREILFGLPEKISPQISPDGSQLAYLAPSEKVLNVWILDRKSKSERVLTRDRGRGIHFYAWAPDGKSVLFLQDQGETRPGIFIRSRWTEAWRKI